MSSTVYVPSLSHSDKSLKRKARIARNLSKFKQSLNVSTNFIKNHKYRISSLDVQRFWYFDVTSRMANFLNISLRTHQKVIRPERSIHAGERTFFTRVFGFLAFTLPLGYFFFFLSFFFSFFLSSHNLSYFCASTRNYPTNTVHEGKTAL